MVVPPTQRDNCFVDSVKRQSQVESASAQNSVDQNASDKSQIMESAVVISGNKRKRKKRLEKGHDAAESNDNLSAVPKDAFSTETLTATLAVPLAHPDECSLDSVIRKAQVENTLKEKSVIENSLAESQIMVDAESTLTKKRRKKRRVIEHNAIESSHNLSAVPNDAFSTETSTAALAVPPPYPDERTLDSVTSRSLVGNALNEKNMRVSSSEKSQIMTSVEVTSRNERKQKKRRAKGHDADKSNDNLSPRDALLVETSMAAVVMPQMHPFEHSVDPLMMQHLAENEGTENHEPQHVTDGYLAVSNLDVNLNNKDKRQNRKKSRHNISQEASTPISNFPPIQSGQCHIVPVMILSQEVNEEKVQNIIGMETDGSTAVDNEEVNPRKKTKKGKRRKTACKEIKCDINHYEVPKDAFSPECCTVTLHKPSQYAAPDVVGQCLEENQGKDLNTVDKTTDGSPAIIDAEMNSRNKDIGEGWRKIRHDSLQGNVNLNISRGGISHPTLVNNHDHYKASQVSCGRAISSYPGKKLLVLDINGLLADIVIGVPKGYKPFKKIYGKAVFMRPFCNDFLEFCFDKFYVGIWSSRKRRNVSAFIEILVGASASKLLFAWDRSYCTNTKFQTIEEGKPLVFKELRRLWENSSSSLPWNKGEFNETNTLLLDDCPYKAARNPMHSGIFPYPYRYSNTNDTSLGPGGDLRVYLEGLATAENVQEYVASHPFGQPPITEPSSRWNLYCEVGDPRLSRKKETKETKIGDRGCKNENKNLGRNRRKKIRRLQKRGKKSRLQKKNQKS